MPAALIVSPCFPPTNTPDMHRVRLSLPYFAEFGWHPVVLAVRAEATEGPVDPALEATVSRDIVVHRTGALPVCWARKVGIRNLGLRALPMLYREGCRIIRRERPDLVYFSTTVFPVLILGRLWRQHFGIPFVVDLQDPWVGEYYDARPHHERPPKYRLAQAMHRVLERWTMPRAGGVIAVSAAYCRAVEQRYPALVSRPSATIVFGADRRDFEAVAASGVVNHYFDVDDGLVHGVYAGVLGPVMRTACRRLCEALHAGLLAAPNLFSRIRLHFIGTSYAPGNRAQETIAPLARQMGLGKYVDEHPRRTGYLTVLKVLRDADFLLLVGSDNPQYTASKIYPYVLAEKPLLALLHGKSSAARILRETEAAHVVDFTGDQSAEQTTERLLNAWRILLARLPFRPATNWQAFEAYSARELTRRQCEVFDQVVSGLAGRGRAPDTVSCGGEGCADGQEVR